MPPKRKQGIQGGNRFKTPADRKRWERANETPEQTRLRLETQRELQSARRDGESESETAARRQTQKQIQSSYRESQTDEETTARLDNQREYQSTYLKSQTDEQTAKRLDKKREYQSTYLESQTVDQTAERLDKQREYYSMLRAEKTAEQHAERLQERVELYVNSLISKSALNLARSQSACEVADNFSAEFSVGSMTFSCTFCDAKFWESEKLSTSTRLLPKFPLCCGQAKVVLPSLATPPDLLAHLLTAGDARGRAFRYSIRAYNSALDFASLGVNLDKQLANAKRGVYTFRIHGTVHHYIGQLMPREGQAPAFAQIYIHDGTPEAEAEYRQQALGEASLPELPCLQAMLHDVNPYVSFFRQGIDVMREHGGADVRMTIRADGASDPRRYNAPTAPEIAVSCLETGITSRKPAETLSCTRGVGTCSASPRPTAPTTRCIMCSYSLEARMVGGLNSLTAEERAASLR